MRQPEIVPFHNARTAEKQLKNGGFLRKIACFC